MKLLKEPYKLLLTSSPCIAEQLLSMCVMTISLMFAGKYNSETMTIVSMINTVIVCLQCAFIGFTTAGTILIGRLWGAKEKEKIPVVAMQVNTLSVAVAILLTIFSVIFKDFLLGLIFAGQTNEFLELASEYFVISAIGIILLGMFNSIAGCCRGVGDNTIPMLMALCYVLGDIIFNIILAERFGIIGIAYAMLIARALSILLGYLLLLIKKSPIVPRKWSSMFTYKDVPAIFRIGSMAALEQFVFQGGFVIQQTLLLSFGSLVQAGYQIGANLNNICNAPAYAVGIVATEKVAHALGKDDKQEAMNVYKSVKVIVFTLFLALSIAQIVFAPQLAGIYTSAEDVLVYGKYFIILFGALVVPLAYFQGLSGILRGAGDVKYTAVISFIGLWVARIFTVYILAKLTQNAMMAVIIGVSADFLLRCIAYFVRIKNGRWLSKNI